MTKKKEDILAAQSYLRLDLPLWAAVGVLSSIPLHKYYRGVRSKDILPMLKNLGTVFGPALATVAYLAWLSFN